MPSRSAVVMCGVRGRLIVVILGLLRMSTHVGGDTHASQCSLADGQCAYQVYLSRDCNPVSNEIPNGIQNDYTSKVNEIEKSLLLMQVEYTKKLSELEKRFGDAQPMRYDYGSQPLQPIVATETEPESNDTKTSSGTTNASVPRMREHSLLNDIHEEFAVLRGQLAQTQKRLRVTEKTLAITQKTLNLTDTKLWSTTQTLLTTERLLDATTLEKENLEESLAETQSELNDTQFKLSNTGDDLKTTTSNLEVTTRERDDLSVKLTECKSHLSETNASLISANAAISRQEITQANTTRELSRKVDLLLECQTGKTSVRCGFEDPSICGYVQDKVNDDFDWTWWRATTPSVDTGPTDDHTCANGQGHYMYVEASGKAPDQRGRLVSPRFFGVGPQCVEFYYHMRGFHIGTLNVFTTPTMPLMSYTRSPEYRVYGNQGNVWTRATIDIPTEMAQTGYNITFEVTLERGYQGDVGIDDVRLADGDCASQVIIQEIQRRRPGVRRRKRPLPEE